jgi:hypothetical protein
VVTDHPGRVLTSAGAAGPQRWSLDATGAAGLGASGLLVVAGGLVAAVNSAAPFGHGSWLAAYLVLVGGVAQALLAVGRDRLPGARPATHRRRLELLLWNGGTLVVAAGVLADVPGLVALGSGGLLVALASFGAATATAAGAAHRWRLAYHGLILALAASVVVGCALAFAA